jgi:predicted regulator of Ras-like GTPase activity (Roadblock/LC7/MglB family)
MSVKNFDSTLKKRLAGVTNFSDAFSIVIKELRRAGKLVSCILTDNNGLIIAEAAHPRDDRENLSALVAYIDNAGERIDSYLRIGAVKLSCFITNNVTVLVQPIILPSTKEQYNLLAIQQKNILDSFPKSTLNLLGKEKNKLLLLMDVASKWIQRICKN